MYQTFWKITKEKLQKFIREDLQDKIVQQFLINLCRNNNTAILNEYEFEKW